MGAFDKHFLGLFSIMTALIRSLLDGCDASEVPSTNWAAFAARTPRDSLQASVRRLSSRPSTSKTNRSTAAPMTPHSAAAHIPIDDSHTPHNIVRARTEVRRSRQLLLSPGSGSVRATANVGTSPVFHPEIDWPTAHSAAPSRNRSATRASRSDGGTPGRQASSFSVGGRRRNPCTGRSPGLLPGPQAGSPPNGGFA